MTCEHGHFASRSVGPSRPFIACVSLTDCNPAAHSGVVLVQGCVCGAMRYAAINGQHAEFGPWFE